ncbi:MAG: recombinase family protein, partial [Methylibium sp.]
MVSRVFREYADGKSPRRIAADLNAQNVPSPEGGTWSHTSIRGQIARGTGLLNTTTYVGLLVWNRCSFVRDPDSGKRLARINPTSEWVTQAVPHLRIVDQELWDRVKARQAEMRIEMGRDES